RLGGKKCASAYAYRPTNSQTNFALGNLRLAKNQTEDAKLFYLAVLGIDPHHKGALNNLGVISFKEARFEQALQFFEQAVRQAPRDGKAHYLLAKTLLAQSDPHRAQAEIDKAIVLQPDQPEFKGLKRQIQEHSQ